MVSGLHSRSSSFGFLPDQCHCLCYILGQDFDCDSNSLYPRGVEMGTGKMVGAAQQNAGDLGGGILPYMGYIGTCWEIHVHVGYGF